MKYDRRTAAAGKEDIMVTEYNYPFSAIVGQEDMKTALLLNAINPKLGGVLIRGEKGTAKSTAVRALASLMPEMKVVNLPVGVTEDRVVGTLSLESAIQEGKRRFEPGLLAEADQNLLYIDEINLLDDHIVDLLLDVAAMGVNRVEREGISYSHPSRFVLVGTMNPEEGQLRPQLLDRFGLVTDVKGEQETADRVEVISRRLDFEEDPEPFLEKYRKEEEKLTARILKAKKLFHMVSYSKDILMLAAQIGISLHVDGHRADICMVNTARTLAAWEGRTEVIREDIRRAASYVLPHRMHKRPFSDEVLDWEELDRLCSGEDGGRHEKE
ncbi:ATP-binding protein [Qiania dongpingensis]